MADAKKKNENPAERVPIAPYPPDPERTEEQKREDKKREADNPVERVPVAPFPPDPEQTADQKREAEKREAAAREAEYVPAFPTQEQVDTARANTYVTDPAESVPIPPTEPPPPLPPPPPPPETHSATRRKS